MEPTGSVHTLASAHASELSSGSCCPVIAASTGHRLNARNAVNFVPRLNRALAAAS